MLWSVLVWQLVTVGVSMLSSEVCEEVGLWVDIGGCQGKMASGSAQPV